MDQVKPMESLSTTPTTGGADDTLALHDIGQSTCTRVQPVPESPSQNGHVLAKGAHLMSVRSVNAFVYNEEEIESSQGSVIYFKTFVFIKEMIYQLLPWIAAPFVILFDGGYPMALAHCMIPYDRTSGSIINTVTYIAFLVSNGMWIWYNFEQSWLLEIFLFNLNFIFRAINCSIRYSYLTRNEMKHWYRFYTNKNKNNNKYKRGTGSGSENDTNSDQVWNSLTHTLLLYGWFMFNQDTIKYECKNAELRLD